jgi:general secretion pathway protein C
MELMPAINVRKMAYGVVNLGLITWLAAMVAGVFYNSLMHAYDPLPVYKNSSEVVEHDPAQDDDIHPFAYYQDIISRDLFRTRPAEMDRSQGRDDTDYLETARLDAQLWGTVSGNDSSRFAVIETKDSTNRRKQNLFREGDTIEHAVIKKILRDKVVISLDGQRQLLLLEDYKSQTRRRPSARRTVSRKATYRRIIPRSVIDRAVSDVGRLMTQARIMPRKDGLAISAIKPGSLFRRLGLRNGDVIEGVNGRTIQSVDDALSIYSRLRDDSSVTVDIKRGGQKRTMQYAIR